MTRYSNWITLLAAVLIVGCVVIPDTFDANINITIRHIEEQADQVLDYVEGKTDTPPGLEEPAPEETSLLRKTLDYFSPIGVAHAQELKDSSPRVAQIAGKMKQRFSEVGGAKKTGAVGENNRGLLELAKPELVSGDQKNQIQRIIAAENEDRKALYKEVARLNRDQKLDVGRVERVYAQKRLERARAGELFQLPPAGDNFDAFKASATGKRLGAKCVPGAWVTIQ